MALNPYQKNALQVQMRFLERTLHQARRWLRHPPEDGLLTRYRPVSDSLRPRLEMLIDQMLGEIAVLVEKFGLQPHTEDMGSFLSAEMSGAWSDLSDMLSRKLKRYGEVDPALSETLDPHLARLIRLALQVSQAAQEER
jgi:hypothetical protein